MNAPSRHRGWFTIVAIVGVAVLIAVASFYLQDVFQPEPNYRQLQSYKVAHEYVLSQQMVQAFGTPVVGDLRLMDSRWKESGCCGSADFVFNVKGANGQAVAYVSLIKELGQWRVDKWRMANDPQ